MGTRTKAITVSLAVAVTCGTLVGAVIVLAGELGQIQQRMTPSLLVQALEIGLFASIFVSVPLGIVGGLYASSILRKTPRDRAPRWWIGRGAISGLVMGGAGSAAYVLLLGFGTIPPLVVLLLYFVIGGVAGLICGALVGLWCALPSR